MAAQQQIPENTRLALDGKSNMHVLVRRIPAGPLPATAFVDLEDMNGLLMARDAGTLVRAIDALGLMYGTTDIHTGRVLGADKARRALGSRLNTPSPELLLSELYFDPFSKTAKTTLTFEATGRVAKAPTNRAATELDLIADGSFVRDDFDYVIEPLHDWLILRNLMSISLRLLANSRVAAARGSLDKVLGDTGFRHIVPQSEPAKNALGDRPAYVIPVGYNPFFSRKQFDITWDDDDIWPFFCRITEEDKSLPEKIFNARCTKHLVESPNVRFITSVQIDTMKASLNLKKKVKGAEDTWLYLALIADNDGQEATANKFLRAMDDVFGTRSIECGGERGAELRAASHPTNLPEAMWVRAWDHQGRYLMSCKHCGRVTFAYMLGGETTFCSPGCRSAYSKAHRAAD